MMFGHFTNTGLSGDQGLHCQAIQHDSINQRQRALMIPDNHLHHLRTCCISEPWLKVKGGWTHFGPPCSQSSQQGYHEVWQMHFLPTATLSTAFWIFWIHPCFKGNGIQTFRAQVLEQALVAPANGSICRLLQPSPTLQSSYSHIRWCVGSYWFGFQLAITQ